MGAVLQKENGNLPDGSMALFQNPAGFHCDSPGETCFWLQYSIPIFQTLWEGWGAELLGLQPGPPRDWFCTANFLGHLVKKYVQNTCMLYAVSKIQGTSGTMPFFIVEQARYSNLSLTLKGLSQHVLDHWIPEKFTRESSPYISMRFRFYTWHICVLPRHLGIWYFLLCINVVD